MYLVIHLLSQSRRVPNKSQHSLLLNDYGKSNIIQNWLLASLILLCLFLKVCEGKEVKKFSVIFRKIVLHCRPRKASCLVINFYGGPSAINRNGIFQALLYKYKKKRYSKYLLTYTLSVSLLHIST